MDFPRGGGGANGNAWLHAHGNRRVWEMACKVWKLFANVILPTLVMLVCPNVLNAPEFVSLEEDINVRNSHEELPEICHVAPVFDELAI